MDFHGINASVRTGIYSMVPLTPAFPAREIINVSSSAAAAYADPRAWVGKNVIPKYRGIISPVFFYTYNSLYAIPAEVPAAAILFLLTVER